MKILMKGNEAIAEAAINAGCRAFFGYPITPQNEIPEYLSKRLPEVGGVFVQSESEIAAINMVYGASASGARVMTSSSSPGIALKQEGISYLAASKLPCVIVSAQRSGPGLGGILPSQADYFQATRGGGNGDYNIVVYAPSSIQESTDLVQKAFMVAEKYRTPVMVLVDGMIAQMMEAVEIKAIDIPERDKSWAASGDSDKRERNIINSLNLIGTGLEQQNIELQETYKKITEDETMYESSLEDGDEILFVAYGTPSRIVVNAMEELEEKGIKCGLVRPITLWPFPKKAFENIPSSVKNVLVCELSMGQMVEDVDRALKGQIEPDFYGRSGGVIFEPSEIVNKVLELRGK